MSLSFPKLGPIIGLVASLLAAAPAAAQWSPSPAMPNGTRWLMGVQVQNTSSGVVLTSVVQNGAAANAGLAVGDRILAIGGHQVGYVDNRLVDLGDEINEHVSDNGQISMLVLTSRGALQSGTLTLASNLSVIEGSAVFQGGERPSAAAVMNIRLFDVSHAQWNGVVVSQWTWQRIETSPLAFRLSYNPQQVQRGHRYAIEAEIVDRGRVIYRTRTPAAITLGGGRITLTLAATTAPPRPVPYDQVTQWYQNYLGRLPTQQEIYAWENQINRGQPVSSIQSYLLGSTEYYNRYENDVNQYLAAVHRSLFGDEPTQDQMQQLRAWYNQNKGIRTDFVQQVQQAPRDY